MDSSSYGRPPDPNTARLMGERDRVDPSLTQVHKIIQEEIERRSGLREPEYIEVDLNKNMKLSKKVLVPLHRNPGFNYVGKLMGPGGKTLKTLQEKNNVKLHVLGRGSSKDKNKEQELLLGGDPKYSHYAENLHVRIDVLAPPAEAFRRMADALEDIKAHFNTDLDDEISKAQKEEGFIPKEPKVTNFRSGGRGGGGGGGGDSGASRGRGRGGSGGGGGFRGRGSPRGGPSGRGGMASGRGGTSGGYGTMPARPAAPPIASDYGVGDYNSPPTAGYYNASFNDQYGQSHSQATNMPYGNPAASVRPTYNSVRPPGNPGMSGMVPPFPRPPVPGGSHMMMGGQNGSPMSASAGGGKMPPQSGQMYGGYRMHPYGARNDGSYE